MGENQFWSQNLKVSIFIPELWRPTFLLKSSAILHIQTKKGKRLILQWSNDLNIPITTNKKSIIVMQSNDLAFGNPAIIVAAGVAVLYVFISVLIQKKHLFDVITAKLF